LITLLSYASYLKSLILVWILNNTKGQNFTDLEFVQSEYLSILTTILPKTLFEKYNASEEFLTQTLLLIYLNVFVDVSYFIGFLPNKFDFVIKKDNIAYQLHQYRNREVAAILIPIHTSKQELKNWLDDNWEKSEQLMDDCIEKDVDVLKPYRHIEIAQEIVKLKESGKTFSDIATLLQQKYGESDKRFEDEYNVKRVYYSYLEMRDKFENIFPLTPTPKGTKK
jgi:lambda repressor-like predicted transcriptional regulator